MVKCPYCEQEFKKTEDNFIKIKNRYYHKNCFEKQQADNLLIEKIQEKTKNILGASYSPAKVRKQIKNFQNDGISLESILNALTYWYDIKENDISKANGGIGIVEYIFPESDAYWREKKEDKEKNLNVDYGTYLKKDIEEFVIKPKPFKKPKRIKLFKLV